MKRWQAGIATIEFALVGVVFFVVLFGIFEAARVLFTWNTLTEATRRGARMAVVCPLQHDAIARFALFKNNNETNSILAAMSPDDVNLAYLDQYGNALADPVTDYLSVRFVKVSIEMGIPFPLLMPGVDQLVTLPEFATVLPVESLGVSRDSEQAQCLGVAGNA